MTLAMASRHLFVIAMLTIANMTGVSPVFSQPAPSQESVSPSPGDPQKGAALYQMRCTGCHSVERSKFGPAHSGLVGRRVGGLPGYKYSEGLSKSTLTWNSTTLNSWLTNPEAFIPGQRMNFKVDDAQERADLIAYLCTLK